MKTKIPSTLVAAALAASCLLPGNADAAMIVNFQEQGSDVVATYSGSIDITGIGFNTMISVNVNRVNASIGSFYLLNGVAKKASLTIYSDIPWTVAPSAFGTGGNFTPDTISVAAGNAFGFASNGFYIEPEYVSGSMISGSMTFNNQTLASMGINEGTGIMNATFSSGDTLTVNAIAAVPEPSSSLLGLAGLIFGSAFWRRRKLA